jgi:acyl-coenzyme A synthetase/AMP-(fatty) acid ligase/acyl carrier protein
MDENRLYQDLIACAGICPEQIALEELVSGKSYSYLELLRLVDAGIVLLESNYQQDTVVILADLGIDSVVAYYAVVCSGRTAAVIDNDFDSSYGVILKTKFPELCLHPADFVFHCSTSVGPIDAVRNIPTVHEVESVLFTSGSTGEPKIFGIPSNRGRLEKRVFSLTDGEEYAVLNVRRPSSTPFRVNLQRALANRGRFISVDTSTISPSAMDKLLAGRLIHEWSVTPTMVRKFLPFVQGAWVESVRRLHVNGERIYHKDLELIFRTMPDITVRVNYGLTETGNISEGLITAEDLPTVADPVHAGTLTKDVEIRDEASYEVVQQGLKGRVFVRGVNGLVGTLSDEGQFTFQRFPLDEWQDTGDRGFLNSRNELVVLGRTEETVKIRGSRISILEVETIIRETGMVFGVLVAVYQDAAGNDSLGMLVVPTEGTEFTLAELRRRIIVRYSLVMSPTRSLIVSEIPVLGTGKVDRMTAMMMLNDYQPEIVATKSDMTLNMVRDIVLTVLPIQSLRLDEDIFEAGIDSLASLEVLDRLSDAFGVSFDVRVLLENPTVSSLARALQDYVQPEGRLVRLSTAKESAIAKVYWILPGANPFMAQKLAVSIDEIDHITVCNLGCLRDEIVLLDADAMISCLVQAIATDSHENENIFIAGFSSAGMLASEVARLLFERHALGKGLILLDPADLQVHSQETRWRGTPNPLHVMLGREGHLSRLDAMQLDRALLGIQLAALTRLKLHPISIPTLQLSRNQTVEEKSLWGNHSMSQYFPFDIPHLEFVRIPEHCAPLITEFVRNVLEKC